MPKTKFKGTGVAIVTPFRRDGSVDFSSMRKLIEHQIKGGVDYIVALGTTGESVTLSNDEKIAVINFVVDEVDGRIPVVMGVGGNNTQEVVNKLKEVCDGNIGIDGVLSVTPYYNKPGHEGLCLHYREVANACNLPVILYNVPGRTGVNMSAETTLKLACEISNIAGIKEASGNFNQINRIIRDKPDGFLVISGDDPLTVPMISLGASGVISVSANTFPFEFSQMVRHALSHKFSKAQAIQNALLDIMDAHFIEGNPAGVKASLCLKGIVENNLRLPLNRVSDTTFKKIESLLEDFEMIKKNLPLDKS